MVTNHGKKIYNESMMQGDATIQELKAQQMQMATQPNKAITAAKLPKAIKRMKMVEIR